MSTSTVLVLLAVLGVVGLLAVVLRDRARLVREGERREAELTAQRTDLERRADRLLDREDRLEAAQRHVEERAAEVDEAEQALARRGAGVEEERRAVLEEVGGTSVEEARAAVVVAAEQEARLEVARRVRGLEEQAQAEVEWRARRVLSTVVQRLAASAVADAVSTTVPLVADDVKGRIIGREGRNIRTFEQVTGVNVVIDDTPASVLLSCFDPVRREVARVTLLELVEDGRIHPVRIEEVHARALESVERGCREAAQRACLDVGVTDLHPDLLTTLGHLHHRTSYGQNVLAHLVESAHIAGLLAAEVGVAPATVVRAAFLHDVGKALTHEVEGSHAIVGADLARRCGEHPDVVHAIEAHHNEVEPRTVEAYLVQAADAVSGARPGARREPTEEYQQRLRRLEDLARAHPGVDRVHAMSAGRDLRVMVLPDEVDDLAAADLARRLAAEIESELSYPGQITVTVVRESRATETAR